MTRSCTHCHSDYETGSNRAKFCSNKCRMAAHYAKKTGAKPSRPTPAAVRVTVKDAVEEPGDIVASTRAALVAAGRAGSPEGHLCLILATAIASGVESPTGLAALSKELTARLTGALINASVAADPVDELRQRRERRGVA